jgi:hypothetical protein
MVSLGALWLPILLSAILVFVASAIAHMVLTYHRSDYARLPKEDQVLDGLRAASIPPGAYAFPYADTMKEMGSPEMRAKQTRGPVGLLTVRPSGPPAMGKSLLLWFVYCLVVGVFAAYLAGRTLGPGADYLTVFRITGTVAFLGYAGGEVVDTIWKAQSTANTVKGVIDGLVYALLTAGAFGWLWPAA